MVVTTLHDMTTMRVRGMTTYGIREFKARVSEILRSLDDGEDVIITRRGKPCGRLTPVQRPTVGKPSLGTLRGRLTELPDASYEDFLDIKALWEPGLPASVSGMGCAHAAASDPCP